MIKAVVFDLDGVYFTDSATNEFINAISLKFNVDAEDIKKIFPKSDIMYEYRKGNISGEKFWQDAADSWKSKTKTRNHQNLSLKDIADIIKKVYIINKPVKDAVMKLRKKGILTIACSNNFKERVDALEEKFHFLKEFDYYFLSYEHHMLKPELFEKVFEQINMNSKIGSKNKMDKKTDNPNNKRVNDKLNNINNGINVIINKNNNYITKDEILIIDDVKRIIDAAKQMGFKTILCEDASKIEKEIKNYF